MPSEEQYRALEKRISFLERLEPGTGLVDYFSTSTKVGWASYTRSVLSYKRIGGLLYVFFYIQGASNSTDTSVTLPYAATQFGLSTIWTVNNTATIAFGFAEIVPTANVLTFYRDAATSAWTNTNNKTVEGQIVVPI